MPLNLVIPEAIEILLVEVQMIEEGLFVPMAVQVEEIKVEVNPEADRQAVEDRRDHPHHQMEDHRHQ